MARMGDHKQMIFFQNVSLIFMVFYPSGTSGRRRYCGMYLPPYFFLPQHIIFSKNIVLCAMRAKPQHNIF